VQAERRYSIGLGKLPSRTDRLHDFKTVATQSMLSSNVLSSMPGVGATASLKTISGSIRGSARPNLPVYSKEVANVGLEQ
jgi:hypothetical protein